MGTRKTKKSLPTKKQVKKVHGWAVTSRDKQKLFRFLFSSKGAERNASWFGEERIVPITITWTITPPKKKRVGK